MSKANTYFFFFFFLILIMVQSCQTGEEESSYKFFVNAKYKTDYFGSLPIRSPDSSVQRIKNEVPTQWQGFACERTYYNIPEDLPDSLVFRYLDLFEKVFPHDTVAVFTQALRGKLFLRRTEYDTALICMKTSYALAHRINNLSRIADAEYSLGQFYSRRGNYSEAIKIMLKAYGSYLLVPNSENNGQLMEIMINLGAAYHNANDYKSAKVWYQRAWQLAWEQEVLKDYKITAAAEIANNYLHLNQLDSAKTMIDTSFYFHNLYQNYYKAENHYAILAQIQLAQGHCAAALPNALKAQQINTKPNNLVAVHRFNAGIADVYLCLGRLDSAVVFYKQALASPDSAEQVRIYAQLGKMYAQNGNHALAYQHQLSSQYLSERVFTIEKDKEIGRLEAANEVERRERQVEEQVSQNKIARISMIAGMFALLLGLFVSLFFVNRKKQALLLAMQEKELIEARELLKTQALARVEQELEQAEQDLEVKEHALTESMQQLDLKNILIQQLEMKLTQQNWESPPSVSNQIEKEQLQNLKILTPEDWRKFRQLFNQHEPDFITNLTERFPKLTAAEMRLVLLIKLGFDAAEISNVLGIESSSVYKSRYRLRKKLDLEEEDDLEGFIQSF